jgi:hypothetical protein
VEVRTHFEERLERDRCALSVLDEAAMRVVAEPAAAEIQRERLVGLSQLFVLVSVSIEESREYFENLR